MSKQGCLGQLLVGRLYMNILRLLLVFLFCWHKRLHYRDTDDNYLDLDLKKV